MPLGLENIPGLGGVFGDLDINTLFTGAFKVVSLFLMFIIAAALFGFVLYRKSQKKLYTKDIHWFEEVHGDFVPVESDKAAELTIPGTQVKVFYIKKKDLYLPRGTRKMGVDAYWYGIRSNREIINFVLKNLNKEMTAANLDYDHTDMRYASENLREIIKRNYRDKSQPWWREYKEVIGVIIFVFVFSLAFFFLIGKIENAIGTLGAVAQTFENAAQTCANPGSGVQPA